MWTKAQTAAFQRALAQAEKHDQLLERLELIAKHSPLFRERIADLRSLHEHTKLLAQVALSGGTDTSASSHPSE